MTRLRLSYKSRKLINKPEEEWIRVEGTHEPIISREVWDTVVSIDKKKVRKTPPTDGKMCIRDSLMGGISVSEYARRHNIRADSAKDLKTAIQKKYKNIFLTDTPKTAK